MTKYDFEIATHNKYNYNLLVYFNNGYYNISSVKVKDNSIYICFSTDLANFIKCTVGDIQHEFEKLDIDRESKDVHIYLSTGNIVYECEIALRLASVVILDVIESSEKGSKLPLKECDYTNFKFIKNKISVNIERNNNLSIFVPIGEETPKPILNLVRDMIHKEVNSFSEKKFPSIYSLYMNSVFKVVYSPSSKPKVFLKMDIYDEDNYHWVNGDFYVHEESNYYYLLLDYIKVSVSNLLFSFDTATDFKCDFSF